MRGMVWRPALMMWACSWMPFRRDLERVRERRRLHISLKLCPQLCWFRGFCRGVGRAGVGGFGIVRKGVNWRSL